MIRRPAPRPCDTCPYRRDVPSGVWSPDEYAKLPAYDRPTAEQPTGVFMCHQQNGRVCGGWAGCHDAQHLLALRFARFGGDMSPAEVEATVAYVSPVPLWGSGSEAAAHGLADVDDPGTVAQAAMSRLLRKRRAR